MRFSVGAIRIPIMFINLVSLLTGPGTAIGFPVSSNTGICLCYTCMSAHPAICGPPSDVTPIFGDPYLVWTPQQSWYLKQHDYHILLDLAQLNAELSSWQWQELPDHFQPALGGLRLWQPCLIPSCRAWHVTHGVYSSWLIKILSSSPPPLSSLVNIVFRKRQLSNPMTTPIVGAIFFNNPVLRCSRDPQIMKSGAQ